MDWVRLVGSEIWHAEQGVEFRGLQMAACGYTFLIEDVEDAQTEPPERLCERCNRALLAQRARRGE